ncbi:MAG: hypothetical protein MJ016_00400 [Victivallaceae bacterium]|nr:hypothetical protein [Victivallaceae bacterium]
MFAIRYCDAFLLMLLAWICYLFVLWRRESARLDRNEWHLTHEQLFHCDRCHHSFVLDEPMNLTRCPRCNAVCIRRKRP